jgi:hypothetical protein
MRMIPARRTCGGQRASLRFRAGPAEESYAKMTSQSIGGDDMTEPGTDEAHGRLVRECEDSRRKVAGLESELKRIGAAFVETGNKLQNDPSVVAKDRMTVEKDLAELWLLLPEYAQAVRNKEKKKAELEKLKSGGR